MGFTGRERREMSSYSAGVVVFVSFPRLQVGTQPWFEVQREDVHIARLSAVQAQPVYHRSCPANE